MQKGGRKMEQESYSKKRAGFILMVCYGIGLICGCMMMRLQMTEEAKASEQLLLGILAQMQLPKETAAQWAMFALRLFLPGLLGVLCCFCFGLWMVGQPFLLLLFAGMGLRCGCFGILLLTKGYGVFTLFWYLPVAVLYVLALFPVGCHGLTFGVQLMQGKPLRKELKRYIGLTVRQLVWLALICAAAVLGYWLYGIGVSA